MTLFEDHPVITIEQDQQNRKRIKESLSESLVVEAAAGTGKTTQLVARVVSVLKAGLSTPDQLVAVTFTRKAAGELKLRLRQALEEERRHTEDSQDRRNLEEAIARLEEARIGTIHSFCAELLRERPVEAGVDPDFGELDEDSSQRLFDQAFQTWIQRKLNEMPEALNRALSRLATWKSYPQISPLNRLRDTAWYLAEWRDFDRPWRRQPFDREQAVQKLLQTVDLVARASALCDYRHDYLRKALKPARFFLRQLKKWEDLGVLDLNQLEAGLIDLYRQLKRDRRKGRGKYADTVTRQQMLEYRETLLAELEDFETRANADLAAQLRELFCDLLTDYEELKHRQGALDFVDLLIRVRDLLRQNTGVRTHLQERFSHIFVDEFQDTDPLQAEILVLLCSDQPQLEDWREVRLSPGKIFVVGDPKQSIYRFRRADVLLYQEVKQLLLKAGAKLVYLSRNFRSIRPLQQAVNAAFEPVMKYDPVSGQPDYVPLLEFLPKIPKQPSLVALPVPAPYGYTRISRRNVEESQPAVVAAFLEWLLRESGWKVRDPEDPNQLIDLLPQHVCLLFRRFLSWNSDVTRPYVEALEARGLPHVLVGSRTFHQREEVETLRAALTAVEWPDDELAVFATLKGSLFAVGDAALFRFRQEIGRLHPFQRIHSPVDSELEPVREALGLLAELHRQRNDRPIVQTVQELLEFTRAHAGFALRPAGEQVLANVQKICDMARTYELSSGLSFRGFVDLLIKEADKPKSNEAPVIEEGAEGVRIMTLHAAKGLEFPVVILSDITAGLASREPDKYVDLKERLCAMRVLGCSPWELIDHIEEEQLRDRAEGIRIAYVAATRARDLLAIPAVGDEPIEGWVQPLNSVVYPSKANWRASQPAPGCPDFGPASVLERPSQHDRLAESSVKPGKHQPEFGGHSVVWWDPALFDLSGGRDFGVRQDRLLRAAEDSRPAAENLRQYQEWKERRAAVLERGSTPALHLIAPARDEAELPPEARVQVQFELLDRPANRPSGRRFGALVHTVLRDVRLDADPDEIQLLAQLHGRVARATELEVQAAVQTVLQTLQHELLQRARASTRCHRELPFILPLPDGRTVEGIIDLVFREQANWVIVDFKTDADVQLLQQRYKRQVQWYAYSLSVMEQGRIEGWLLAV